MGYKPAWYQTPAGNETFVLKRVLRTRKTECGAIGFCSRLRSARRPLCAYIYFLPREALISANVVSRSGTRL
jgi:hypothetical protein